MMQDRAIRSVCIVGGGMVALSSALAFARALPHCRITLVATPSDHVALADRLPSMLPSSRRFHAMLGIDERELVQRGVATHRLGTEFLGWSKNGEPWIHAFGEYGLPASGVAFHQLWARARHSGTAAPFDSYSLAAVMGAAGKFVHPRNQPGSPLAAIDYALRIDPVRYAALLSDRLGKTNVDRCVGEVAMVERNAGGEVSALLLDGGQQIAADLYVDCSGSQRRLSHRATQLWEDWLPLFPFHRFTIDSDQAAAVDVLDRITADAAGWQASFALGDHMMRVKTDTGPRAIPVTPGRLRLPWQANVVAIGDAAIVLDPLLPLHLSIAHNAIERVLSLLPARDCHPVEIAEYNRLTQQESDRVRDFALLFYLRSGRTDGVWGELARRHPPDSLALTLDQFEARGRLPFFEQELFDSNGWLAALFGLGMMPRHSDPIATRIVPEVADAAMARLAASHRYIASQALPYPAYLAQMQAAARR